MSTLALNICPVGLLGVMWRSICGVGLLQSSSSIKDHLLVSRADVHLLKILPPSMKYWLLTTIRGAILVLCNTSFLESKHPLPSFIMLDYAPS